MGHITASLCHGSSRSVRHSQPVPEALVSIFLASRSATRRGFKADAPLFSFFGYNMPFYEYNIRIGSCKSFRKFEFELMVVRWNLCARCSKVPQKSYVPNSVRGCPWVVQWICPHQGSLAHLYCLTCPFSWSSANGAVFVSCGYYMLNCWNVVSYLITILVLAVVITKATVLFASVVLCRERIGICFPSYFSSSHPMIIFEM